MKNICVLVANKSEAKIFEQDFPRSQLTQTQCFDHPEARQFDQNLVSDMPGRAFDSKGFARHAMEPVTDPKQYQAMLFAKSLAEFLNAKRNQHAFDKLVLVAPPEFLGMLHDHFQGALLKMVVAEVNKNLVKASAQAIQNSLPYSY